MGEVKWIKITTNIFDDEKIKLIDTMPARDEILVIWFKLLTLAGKTNEFGMLMLSPKLAYTVEMLSAIFNREVPSVKFALTTFEKFGMIEIEDNEVIKITNWDKHQNIQGLEKIKENNKKRQQDYRNKKALADIKKQIPTTPKKRNVTNNVTVTSRNALEEELEKEKELERDIKEIKKKVDNASEDANFIFSQFDKLSKSYPRQTALKTAYKYFKRDISELDKIIKGTDNYVALTKAKKNENYILGLSNFLKEREWDKPYLQDDILFKKELARINKPNGLVKKKNDEPEWLESFIENIDNDVERL